MLNSAKQTANDFLGKTKSMFRNLPNQMNNSNESTLLQQRNNELINEDPFYSSSQQLPPEGGIEMKDVTTFKGSNPFEADTVAQDAVGAEENVGKDIGADVGADIGEDAAIEGGVEAAGAGLDATGILAPIGVVVGLGGAIYSVVQGLEDLFGDSSSSDPPAPPAPPTQQIQLAVS